MTDVLAEFRLPIVPDCDDWTEPYFFVHLPTADVQQCYDTWAKDPASMPALRDQAGRTPLHYAAHFARDPAIVAVLLGIGSGFDPETRDALGYTPLDYAEAYNHQNEQVLKLLQAPLDRSTGGSRSAAQGPCADG